MRIDITRSVTIPETVRIDRYRRVPELGPKILFFSGGSALKTLSRRLIDYTHNSIHLITAFDSGGSSANIRQAFEMLSVGDLRNRLMALADQSVHGNRDIYRLFAYRFDHNTDNQKLHKRLVKMAQGRDSLITSIPNPMRRIIRNHLHSFLEKMPDDFDLQGASIGNIILAAGYLNNRRHIEPVIYIFSKLVEVRGVVKPITGLSYHLAGRMEDDEIVIGQHRLTGNGCTAECKKIKELFLTKSLNSDKPVSIQIKKKTKDLIQGADLICYPMGSFYTSLMANLLPQGVGQAISETHCPKVFIPNPVEDTEQYGMSLDDTVTTLITYLRKTANGNHTINDLLNIVIVDTKNGNYQKPLNLKKIKQSGVAVIDTELISAASKPFIDNERLINVLLSLA